MKTKEAIHARRAIKHFDAGHKMSAEEVNEILSLAVLAPTAFNIQNWPFGTDTKNELFSSIAVPVSHKTPN